MNCLVKYVKEEGASGLYLASEESGGFDVRVSESGFVPCGRTKLLSTGLRLEIPEGKVGLIVPRSSLGLKTTATIPNSPGILDSDYRGVLSIIIRNGYPLEYFESLIPLIALLNLAYLAFLSYLVANSVSTTTLIMGVGATGIAVLGNVFLVNYFSIRYAFYYSEGDRLAQIVIVDCYRPDFEEVSDLTPTSRGSGGFGSTGLQ
jgi:dUTP pyrophosphatase